MEKDHILPLIFFSFFLLKPISGADDDCWPASCGPTEPQVRFPFRIIGQQPSRCGFPGFHISCNKRNRTILRLQSSRSYIVTRISYVSQVIYIDPQFCRPNRIVDVNLTDTPFDFSSVRSYTFYNCSLQNFGFMYPAVPFPCLSSGNYSVISVRAGLFPPGNMPSSCHEMKTIAVPVRWDGDIREELELMWFTPYCRSCEMEGRACGLKSDDDQTVCLGSSRGIPRRAKYGLSIGIGVPALVCLIGLVCFTASRARDYNHTHHQSIDLFSITIIPQPPSVRGLDGPTIESYPKTVLGESCRLPNDDGTCAICLSDYKPKESLRTIPECNHYFHADCIDEWLKLNATCPVCRNSPESLMITTCSSASSTSVDSS
ncbi:RING-H2 finger protein ATL22-like [Cynara cardunculus var. scolymus]|uniref:RING-type E3 ubiquitin transferase n=1 Tax=Cynara cardunculus var. scolymus TaxID=59895 RepID=A0A118JTK0_CYNCS|nr:RING-H2 finger protein ATL22-like [Cynara cardunculus var. scolymus]KVH90007.1 Zinc finger, RING/FYVE/PHD-type [Cynara cardunculus var. scolymus]